MCILLKDLDSLLELVKRQTNIPFAANFFIFQTASTKSKFSVAYSFSKYALKWSCPIGSFSISQQLNDHRRTRRSATWSRAHTAYMSHNSVESVIQGLGGSGGTKNASYSWWRLKNSIYVSVHFPTLIALLSTRVFRLFASSLNRLFKRATSLKIKYVKIYFRTINFLIRCKMSFKPISMI